MANSEAERIVGISLSGGGIRAAAFGLGTLQALQAEMQLVQNQDAEKRAKYLSAVSGGSYIAGALTMLKSDYPGYPGVGSTDPSRVAFAPGSPEVEFIRRRARYLLGEGALEVVTQFLARLLINLLAVSLIVGILGLLLGGVYAIWLPLLPKGDVGPISWLTAGGAGAFGIGALLVFFDVAGDSPRSRRRDVVVKLLLAGGVGIAILGLLPAIVAWLTFPSDVRTSGLRIGTFLGRATLVTAIALILITALALKVVFSAPAAGRRLSRVRVVLRKLGQIGIELVARVSVPVGLALLSLFAIQQGAEHGSDGFTSRFALILGILAAVFVVLIYFTTPTNYSLHPFYKQRLMSCFCIRQERSGARNFGPGDNGYAYKLSDSAPATLPELRICAAANVGTFGATPAGENVLPWVFSPSVIGIENSHGGTETLFKTTDLEHVLSGGGLGTITVTAAVAITGAAVSPSMGKRTASSVRALLGVFNLRLGVWLPNPANNAVRDKVASGRFDYGLRCWKVFAELFGRNRERGRYVYVSDGGHYENLGLVELLRLQCTECWCIDASGDSPGGTATLSEAMRIAEADLGVRWIGDTSIQLQNFELDEDLSKARSAPTVRRNWAALDYELSSGARGRVWVIKVGISKATPEHLRDYQRQSSTFPYDPTGNQLFRADRFDAYRGLGFDSAMQAISAFQ